MKKIVILLLVAVLVAGMGIGTASAANSLRPGAAGINVDVNDNFVVAGKYFILKDLAVLAEFGVGKKGADAKGTDVGIGGGARKYLTTDDFATFVGGNLFYASTQDGDQKDLSLLGVFGAEYFLNKQFSIEGSVGFGYTSHEVKTTSTTFVGGVPVTTSSTAKETNIGTQRLGVSLNFYFF